MANYDFIPACYEWHYINTEKPEDVLFTLVDPIDLCFDDKGDPVTLDDLCHEIGIEADDELREAYKSNNKEEIEKLSQIGTCDCYLMAKVLYDYYIA